MIKTIVIGAGGYSGAELVGLLSAHPEVEIVGLFGSERSSSAGDAQQFGQAFSRWRNIINVPIERMDVDRAIALKPDAVFLATPAEVSHELVPAFLAEDAIVLDLSGAYRIHDAMAFETHYGFAHKYQHLLAISVYGLPERNFIALENASLIAMPGCYPTSVILPVAALVDAEAIDSSCGIIVDSTSGVSGAGRSPSLKSMYCEVSFGPYNVLSHRHTPEIENQIGMPIIFTPHLAPFDRGLVSTIHARLCDGWNEASIRKALIRQYGHSHFVRVLPPGAWPNVASVRHTNFCDIAVAVAESEPHLIIVSAIDNLLKGAAGQAVQCFNIRFGLPETMALPMTIAGLLGKGAPNV